MDNNNLIIAVILSIVILAGFQYLYVKPQQEHYRQQVLAEKAAQPGAPNAPGAALRDRADLIAETPHIPIKTPELQGSVDLKGASLDDVSLTQYRETIDPESPDIVLLSPAGTAPPHQAYYAEFSWLGGDPSVAVPTVDTEWKTDGKQLSPAEPLKLSWDNGHGLSFERMIAVDEHFMFTVTDSVRNEGPAPATLYPFGLIRRQGKPPVQQRYILHEGPLGVLDGTLEEYKYKDLVAAGKETLDSTGGWLGITDKYWLVALIPPQDEKLSAEFAYKAPANGDSSAELFQTDFRGDAMTLAPGSATQHVTRLFVGAKRLGLLDHYADQYNIPHFDRAIDFGWFYFLTKPFLYLLDWLGHFFGNFGLAILAFTVMLKVVTLPLSGKSYRAMGKMKILQPELKRIQERFADDKMRQSVEMMELYKREKVSPASGCVPTLIQIPIFFALYKVLYVGIEMRQTPFYGWIKDLSMPDPTSVFTGFGHIPWDPPALLHIGVWPLIMGVSMFLQQRLSPQPPDKTQARIFMFMPIMFTFMLAQMPAGLVIYWTWSNLLSIVQQWFVMRHAGGPKK
jgi:YidC/Oxa1 family membrane protein insertase